MRLLCGQSIMDNIKNTGWSWKQKLSHCRKSRMMSELFSIVLHVNIWMWIIRKQLWCSLCVRKGKEKFMILQTQAIESPRELLNAINTPNLIGGQKELGKSQLKIDFFLSLCRWFHHNFSPSLDNFSRFFFVLFPQFVAVFFTKHQ